MIICLTIILIRSKEEGKSSKSKFVELQQSKGVRVTPLTMIEPKDKSLLQQAQPGGVMWSIGDGKGGSINIKVLLLLFLSLLLLFHSSFKFIF